ncbi:unnamed protein product [Ambrosiozyma monospora]|uniref:Unnamed protein product n=1 Tax=Ambrosiozyma monospora TaxID=43982 RepID=A0ACB5T7S3_AMBMO|nr:unnamed protein product [Ambrosiozyma monospora]
MVNFKISKSAKVDDITDMEEAEKYLTLTVSKSDFLKMEVIGQFNLGFIIVSKKGDDGKISLFIVDQHASDEKFNFERYQRETVFENQPLVQISPLQLSVIDELTVMSNLDVFKKNGFKMKIDEDAEPGARVRLMSLPYSRNTVFDIGDFNELIHLIKENDGEGNTTTSTRVLRPKKVRAMFAMRACRSSIMIGRTLTYKTMTRVVRNLSTLDKPWNCPHGRPTMRHLTDMNDWEPFMDDYS